MTTISPRWWNTLSKIESQKLITDDTKDILCLKLIIYFSDIQKCNQTMSMIICLVISYNGWPDMFLQTVKKESRQCPLWSTFVTIDFQGKHVLWNSSGVITAGLQYCRFLFETRPLPPRNASLFISNCHFQNSPSGCCERWNQSWMPCNAWKVEHKLPLDGSFDCLWNKLL